MNILAFVSKKFIRRVAFVLIFFAGLYYFLISPLFRPLGGGFGDDGLEKGIIRAQRYAFDLQNPKIVVVGTSLSERMYVHLIGEQVYNLAIAQFASHTGLEIIKRKKEKPKFILIEGNYLHIGSTNQAQVELIYNPTTYWLAEHFRMFRQEYYPKQIVRYLVSRIIGKEDFTTRIIPGIPQRVDLRTGQLPPVDQVQLEELRKEANTPLSTRPLEEEQTFAQRRAAVPGYPSFQKIEDSPDNILVIKKYMDELAADGCRFIFYFVPQPKGAMVTANLNKAIDTIKRFFPNVPIIADPDESRYQLEDTNHPDSVSFARFTFYLRDKVAKMLESEKTSMELR